MSISELWQRAAQRLQNCHLSQQDGEVRDELMFHFRELVNEKLAEGFAFDAAWERAEQQFGPMRHYEEECRTAQVAASNKRRYLVGLAISAVVAAAAFVFMERPRSQQQDELRLLRAEFDTLRQEQTVRNAETGRGGLVRRIPGGFDLNGAVLDDGDRPLSQVTVLVIRKTWPGGGYRQEAFTATTNDNGRFALPEFVPADGQYGIQVAALKEGFAFQSAYQLKDRKPIEKPDPIALRLERASNVTLAVRDSDGRPVANAQVIPSARKSRLGEGHMIYFHGSQDVAQATDADGKVRLNCFLTGDRAEIYVRLPGEGWNNRKFDVASDNQLIDLAATMAVDTNDGS